MRRFVRFVCIDWSGAAVARPAGIALAVCSAGDGAPELVRPVGGWSREAVLDWLLAGAAQRDDMLVGIDFSASLPFADYGAYLPGWNESPADARALWALIDRMCADEPHLGAGAFVEHPSTSRHFRRHGGRLGDLFGHGAGRLRETERRCRTAGLGAAQSAFNLVGAAQVGKAALTGMRLLHRLVGRVPVWPFDPVPDEGPAIVEIYTAIAMRAAGVPGGRKVRDGSTLGRALAALGSAPQAPMPRCDDHATDAMIGAAWLRRAASDSALWSPPGLDSVRMTEGWTFGVP